MNALFDYIFNDDVNMMKYGITILRRFLSNKEANLENYSPYLGENERLVKRICQLICFPDENVKYEALWLLINITTHSTKSSEYILQEDNLANIFEIMLYCDNNILENLIWLVGNIVCDSAEARNYFIHNYNIYDFLGDKLKEPFLSLSLQGRIIWILCNFLKYDKSRKVEY